MFWQFNAPITASVKYNTNLSNISGKQGHNPNELYKCFFDTPIYIVTVAFAYEYLAREPPQHLAGDLIDTLGENGQLII